MNMSLWAAVFVALFLLFYLVFWVLSLCYIMHKRPEDFPGPHDKWIWIIIFICFAPLAPVIVVAFAFNPGGKSRPAMASADASKLEAYRDRFKRLQKENRTLKAKLEAGSDAAVENGDGHDLDGQDDVDTEDAVDVAGTKR